VEIFVRHKAEFDVWSYFEYLHERNPEGAVRFPGAVDRTIESLALQPLKGRPRHFKAKQFANIRSWRVDGFETFLIFYRYTPNRLEIIRVRHGAMNFPRALRTTD